MNYFDQIKKSMDFLSLQKDTIFLGQAVVYPGTAMSNTLKDVNPSKLLELPVFEEMQMGLSIGLSLEGYVPISIFPRWNFLLIAINQLVNHLDKLKYISSEKLTNKVIIRTSIGSERPLNPQYQHIGDFTESVRKMLYNIDVIRLENPEDIFSSYKHAYQRNDERHTILVEYGDYYNEK